jgi:hypothetical protein
VIAPVYIGHQPLHMWSAFFVSQWFHDIGLGSVPKHLEKDPLDGEMLKLMWDQDGIPKFAKSLSLTTLQEVKLTFALTDVLRPKRKTSLPSRLATSGDAARWIKTVDIKDGTVVASRIVAEEVDAKLLDYIVSHKLLHALGVEGPLEVLKVELALKEAKHPPKEKVQWHPTLPDAPEAVAEWIKRLPIRNAPAIADYVILHRVNGSVLMALAKGGTMEWMEPCTYLQALKMECELRRIMPATGSHNTNAGDGHHHHPPPPPVPDVLRESFVRDDDDDNDDDARAGKHSPPPVSRLVETTANANTGTTTTTKPRIQKPAAAAAVVVAAAANALETRGRKVSFDVPSAANHQPDLSSRDVDEADGEEEDGDEVGSDRKADPDPEDLLRHRSSSASSLSYCKSPSGSGKSLLASSSRSSSSSSSRPSKNKDNNPGQHSTTTATTATTATATTATTATTTTTTTTQRDRDGGQNPDTTRTPLDTAAATGPDTGPVPAKMTTLQTPSPKQV